ncbi:MAG: ATP-binding protein [Candidatus Limnocylindrales bacterium]
MRPVAPLPTGTVTFLFTDIEGSTRLLRELADGYPAVLADHDHLLLEAVRAEEGAPFGSAGDAIFAAFSSAPRALAAAARAQLALESHPWPDGVAVRVRMGIHSGEGTLSGGTYVGLDVHRAARIASAAHGGQVLVSATARALAETSLAPDLDLRDLGMHRLRDLGRPERLYQLVVPGMPAEFPPLSTLDATPNNLPTQLTSFVGRGREVAEARQLLAGTHLLTLTGPGGTGKTRLSLQLAADVSEEFPDGVFFVPLASVTDPRHLAPAILLSVGLQDSDARAPEERLTEYLRDRRALLVLDNFEQLTGAAPVVAELLRAAANVRVLVTSRAALHVSGEQEYQVPPLGLPDPHDALGPAALSQYEAVALFIERAVAVRPDFQVTNDNAPAVAEICARLDGLPLAIELAAARIKLLPPQALLVRLGHRLDLLAGGARDLPERQQTLRGAIAWSHELLSEASRRLFARFSIFVGGCTLEAAEEVCGPGLGIDVLEGLADLVDQSLVRQDEVDGEPRFAMLATIREFGLERLVSSGEADAKAGGHASAYLSLAERAAPELTRSQQKSWLDRLGREYDNLRAAMTWSIEHGAAETGLRIGAALWRFWQMRGLLREGAEWLDQLLAMPHAADHPEARAAALEAAGGVAYWRGDMETAAAFYEARLELRRSLGDRAAIANALYNASFPYIVSKLDVPRGRLRLDEGLAIQRELGDGAAVARSLWALGNALYFGDELEQARDVLRECVAMLRRLDDPFSLAWALHTLGLTWSRLGDTKRAAGPWREALEGFASAHDLSGIALILGDLSTLAVACDDPVRALRLAGAASQLVASGGIDLATLVDRIEGREALGTGMLDEAAVAAALAEGRAMTAEQAVEDARGWLASLPGS